MRAVVEAGIEEIFLAEMRAWGAGFLSDVDIIVDDRIVAVVSGQLAEAGPRDRLAVVQADIHV